MDIDLTGVSKIKTEHDVNETLGETTVLLFDESDAPLGTIKIETGRMRLFFDLMKEVSDVLIERNSGGLSERYTVLNTQELTSSSDINA